MAGEHMSKQEHRVSVDNGKYTFVRVEGREGVKLIDRSDGEPFISWVKDAPAITAMMCELDAKRVVLHAARDSAKAFGIHRYPAILSLALSLHDSLVSDREPPSAWCGTEYAERDAAEERRATEASATYQAFKSIDTAETVAALEALMLSLAGKLGPADRQDATLRYYQRKAWLETQAAKESTP